MHVREAVAATAAAEGEAFSSMFSIHTVKRDEVIGLVIINEAYDDVLKKQVELNQLLPAIDHVSKHYTQGIEIQELAAVCQISASKRRFSSRFCR